MKLVISDYMPSSGLKDYLLRDLVKIGKILGRFEIYRGFDLFTSLGFLKIREILVESILIACLVVRIAAYDIAIDTAQDISTMNFRINDSILHVRNNSIWVAYSRWLKIIWQLQLHCALILHQI